MSATAGSRTPLYGSQTPMHDGSRTPHYGGATPRYDGGATPSASERHSSSAWDPSSSTVTPRNDFEVIKWAIWSTLATQTQYTDDLTLSVFKLCQTSFFFVCFFCQRANVDNNNTKNN